MLTSQLEQHPSPYFPFSRWTENLDSLSRQYRRNVPVPHLYLPDFVDPLIASTAAAEFPKTHSDAWTHYQHQNENKHGMTRRSLFPETLGRISDLLNSDEFVTWLSDLTGIPGLIADPVLEGGGLHQSGRGGYLNVHTDFSHHHYNKNWKRQVNLILYLNQGWQQDWGGNIELWDSRMRQCVASYPPALNCALIFNTNSKSYHGFPEPLSCPEGYSRKSLAFYYYTVERHTRSAVRSTNYRSRPTDGWKKATLIWLDKQAVNLYSRSKSLLGFSDDWASGVLRRLHKRK